jgi:hypothetical protein
MLGDLVPAYASDSGLDVATRFDIGLREMGFLGNTRIIGALGSLRWVLTDRRISEKLAEEPEFLVCMGQTGQVPAIGCIRRMDRLREAGAAARSTGSLQKLAF